MRTDPPSPDDAPAAGPAWLAPALPVLADLGVLLLSFWLLPLLASLLGERGAWNAVLVGGAYLLFCLAVYGLRKQAPRQDGGKDARAALGALGVFFGVMVLYMAADAGGFLARMEAADAESLQAVSPGWVMLGGAVGLGLVFLYPAVLWAEVRPWSGERRGRAWGLAGAGLVGVNLMILVTVAHWDATFADTEPYEDVALGGKVLVFLLTYVFFLLFYASPRLLFLWRNPSRLGLLTFLLTTGYYLGSVLDRRAW